MSHSDFPLFESPTNASRIPIFAPTRRPSTVKRCRVETSWGWAEISGRLGQLHRDVIDGASAIAEQSQRTPDGRLHLLIDSARLRALLGWDRINYAQLNRVWNDLLTARVEMQVLARGISTSGSLVDEKVSSTRAARRPGTLGGEANLLRITLGSVWSTLQADDLQTRYPLRDVARLRFGISQAVTRYCWTHQRVNEPLAGLAARLGAQRELRKLRAALTEEATALEELGVLIVGDRVKWHEQRHAGRNTPVAGRNTPVKSTILS